MKMWNTKTEDVADSLWQKFTHVQVTTKNYILTLESQIIVVKIKQVNYYFGQAVNWVFKI